MTNPKIRPCPKCGAPGGDLEVYEYDNGWKHVEHDECWYLGPGEGRIRDAIRSHNLLSLTSVPGTLRIEDIAGDVLWPEEVHVTARPVTSYCSDERHDVTHTSSVPERRPETGRNV